MIFSNIVNSFITSILILKHTSRNTIRKYTLYNGTSVHSYHYNNGNNGMAQSGNKLIKMYMYWQFAEYTYIVLYYFTYSMLLDKYSSIVFSWSGAFC